MCCTWLAENTGRKNDAKNRHLVTITLLCRAVSSQLRHVSAIGNKLVKQQYLLHTSHNLVNFSPLAAGIDWRVWGPQQISTAFASWLRYCCDVAQLKPSKLCTTLAVSWAGRLCIHFLRLLPRNGILPGAKFTLHAPSLALSYIGSVTARHCL